MPARWIATGIVRRRASVTLDASGAGSVTFDVRSANEKWIVRSIVSKSSQPPGQVPYPRVTTYVGGQQDGVSSGGSWVGNQETLEGKIEMTACDTLTVSYTGGPVTGIVVTTIIEGDTYQWSR